MADSLLDNYNPLYDIHLRQYFALPHMQKHLQKMGLLESTLNLNGDEVYARHHAMMDMMLKNREAQLVRMAELRKKLDAAEKVECCRRIRTGQSPESYRQGKPSRSLSRNRAGQTGGSGGRQRRYSNSFEDRDFVQRIEDRNSDPAEQNTRDPYKRLSANAKRFNYLHKLDDNTLIAYKDNLKKQLQRLERFREISFGPHSVARQPPPPQASWFFRRRSVLNMRGRKATTGNKLNGSHDNRTSCPPTTRKRKDSNSRLPPIHPQKNRVPTKPPAPVSLQQTTTKLPPAAKKPAPTRGRPSNKRQTATTTTTTISSKSISPQISDTTTTTVERLPSVTGRGIFNGAAAAATAAAIGTTAIVMGNLIGEDEQSQHENQPRSPVLETQKTVDRSSPSEQAQKDVSEDILDKLADESEQVADQEEHEVIHRQFVLDNHPANHGDYENSDSEPEYAEEDRESVEETFTLQEIDGVAANQTEPLNVSVHDEETLASPPVSNTTQEILEINEFETEQSAVHPSSDALPLEDSPSPLLSDQSEHEPVIIYRSPPTLIFTEKSTEEAPRNEASFEHVEQESKAQQSPILDVHTSHTVEHFETHDATPQSPVLSVHVGSDAEHENDVDVVQSPVLSTHSQHISDHQKEEPHSPLSEHHSTHGSSDFDRQSPALSIEKSDKHGYSELAPQSPVASEKDVVELSPSIYSSQTSEQLDQQQNDGHVSPVTSDRSLRSPTIESSVTLQDSSISERQARESSLEHDDHGAVDYDSPTQKSPVNSERAPSVHSVGFEDNVKTSEEPVNSEKDFIHSPVPFVHSPHISEHIDHHNSNISLTQSPTVSEKEVTFERASSVSSSPVSEAPLGAVLSSAASDKEAGDILGHYQADRQSPVDQKTSLEHVEQFKQVEQEHEVLEPRTERIDFTDSPKNLSLSMTESSNEKYMEHEAVPNSPIIDPTETSPAAFDEGAFIPKSPSVHTSDAEEESFEVHHHVDLTQVDVPLHASQSPTEMDLYNPSRENLESPVMSEPDLPSPNAVTSAIPIADRIDLEAYHNSPTKESTSPVAVNPMEVQISAEQVAEQLATPEQKAHFENSIHNSADEEDFLLTQEVLTEAPDIIDMVHNNEEQVKLPEAYEINFEDSQVSGDPMMTSIYQPNSDNEEKEVVIGEDHEPAMEEWQEENRHVKESTTHSDHSNENTHMSGRETVTIVTDDGHEDHTTESPKVSPETDRNQPDNISTDSLIIHEDQNPQNHEYDLQMTQSIYQPRDETEDKEWDEGNTHVHEIIREHTDESGKHFTETVTTTTTVIESGDDLKNNNDGNDQEGGKNEDDDKEKINENKEEHGSNGNHIRETVTTSTRSVTTGLPEGGILVDDGDESNTSSL